VAFFPGYPFATAAAATLAVLVHPVAFFLVVGYSESLFLMALLGFLYWTEARGRASWLLAAGHGFVMTATRITGLPLTAWPLVHAFLPRDNASGGEKIQRVVRAALVCGVASLGGLGFFLYCHLQYGHWDLYMQSQWVSWRVEPDYRAFFNLYNYRVFVPSFNLHSENVWVPWGHDGVMDPDELSRLCVPLTLAAFVVLAALEYRAAKAGAPGQRAGRLGFYLCGGLMYYIAVCGLMRVGMASMIRYTYPVYLLQVLAAVHLLSAGPPLSRGLRWVALFVLALLGCVCVWLQVTYAYLFTHSRWVA
jgi:hypothetical protein